MNGLRQFVIENGAILTTISCYLVMYYEKTGLTSIGKENVYFFCMFGCLNYIHSCIKFYTKTTCITLKTYEQSNTADK